SRDMAALVTIQDVSLKQLRSSRALRNTLLATDPAERRRQKADVEKFVAETGKSLESASRLLIDPAAKQELAKLVEALPAWRQRDLDAAALGEKGKTQEALARMKTATAENEQLRVASERLIDIQQRLAAKTHDESIATYERARWATLVIGGI